MTLQEFLKSNDLSYADFARSISTSAPAVRRYALNLRTPKPDIMSRIHTATGGEVTPNDFYEVAHV